MTSKEMFIIIQRKIKLVGKRKVTIKKTGENKSSPICQVDRKWPEKHVAIFFCHREFLNDYLIPVDRSLVITRLTKSNNFVNIVVV